MRRGRPGTGETIAALGGLALLVLMFFDWFVIDLDVGSERVRGAEGIAEQAGGVNAWQAFGTLDALLFVVAVLAVSLAVSQILSREADLPFPAGYGLAVGGVGAAALVAYRLVDPPVQEGAQFVFTVTAQRQPAGFAALAACAAIVAGGVIAGRRSGDPGGGDRAPA